jgi:Rod binding domain-containing protein
MQVTSDRVGMPMAGGPAVRNDTELGALADQLEAGFLAEMLKAAGFGQSRDSFGGGAGEDQFSSFLVQAQAEKMVAAGGIGLSEALFHALRGTSHGG